MDVLDHDSTEKLARWFEDRWKDHWCLDISKELIQIIEESWAHTDVVPPYHIYIKMAYHLSQERGPDFPSFVSPATSARSCSSSRRRQ